MKVKKIAALICSAVMMLSMGTAALADETVTITKSYELANAGTTSPAETFSFSIQPVSVTDAAEGVTVANMPVPTVGNVTYAAGEAGSETKAKNITVNIPDTYTSVGIYSYEIQETAGTTAGVTYRTEPIRLVVTVTQGENGFVKVAAVHTEDENGKKSSSFNENTYSAGTLSVSKTVTGNMGDQSKYFDFTVTLTGQEGKTYAESYAVSGGSTNAGNPAVIKVGEATTFHLKHGDTISIGNLPYGVTYTVAETAVEGYTTTKTGDSGVINAAEQTAAFTNEKGMKVDTGITLDSMPYILALCFVALCAVVLVARKRFSVNR